MQKSELKKTLFAQGGGVIRYRQILHRRKRYGTGYHTIQHHIPLRHRDRQFLERLHFPYSEEGGYREDFLPLYELWLPPEMVRHDPGIQLSCPAGEVPQVRRETFCPVSSD